MSSAWPKAPRQTALRTRIRPNTANEPGLICLSVICFTERYLRQLYPDPMTGKEWGIVKAPTGGILGVYSLSDDKPFKTAGFKARDRAFEGAQKYSDWKFVYTPPAPPATAAKPAAK